MKFFVYTLIAAVLPLVSGCADLSAPRLRGNISIDGRLNEPMWTKAARIENTQFNRWIDNTYDSDPSTLQMRFFHDGTMLYGALLSQDHYVEADANPENSDGLYSLSFLTHTGKVMHYRLRWSTNPPAAGGEMLVSGKWAAILLGPYNETKRAGNGYVYEFAIRLADLGWKPGDAVPLNIIINDRDGTPRTPYHSHGAEFARFSWGSFDNDKRDDYKTLKLAP